MKKLTVTQLKRLIKEEISSSMNTQPRDLAEDIRVIIEEINEIIPEGMGIGTVEDDYTVTVPTHYGDRSKQLTVSQARRLSELFMNLSNIMNG